MEHIVKLHVERLPEGVYIGTSEDIPGLVAQGRTVAETVEIARDLARKIIELRDGQAGDIRLEPVGEKIEYPLLVTV